METIAVDFNWKATDLGPVLAILMALVFFGLYWFIAKSNRIKMLFLSKYESDQALFKHLFFTKIAGFISMGIFPIIACLVILKGTSLDDYGLTFNAKTSIFSVVWTIILSLIVIPRSKVWTKKMMGLEALAWFLYLFAYELLFRGVLLFPVAASIGIWPAIAVNIALYSATHIPKGLDETIGAIPLGFVLCILTLMSGTIWIAFLVHVVMAWTNTFTALHFNPEMSYYKKKD